MLLGKLKALESDIWKALQCAFPEKNRSVNPQTFGFHWSVLFTEEITPYEKDWCRGLSIIQSNQDIVSGNYSFFFSFTLKECIITS